MKRHWVLVALIWSPFLSIFGFASLGDSSYPHIAFHLFALALLVPAAVLARRAGSATASRTQRVLGRVLFVSLPLAVLGHLLELGAAVVRFGQDGWVNRDTADVWEEGPHLWASNLTVPVMMVSMLAVGALAVATELRSRRRLEPVRMSPAPRRAVTRVPGPGRPLQQWRAWNAW